MEELKSINILQEKIDAHLEGKEVDEQFVRTLQAQQILVQKTKRYVKIEPSLKKSDRFASGEERFFSKFMSEENLQSALEDEVIKSAVVPKYSGKKADKAAATEAVIGAVSYNTYEAKPGEKCALVVRFIEDGKGIKPNGTLILKAKRGKLSKQEVVLNGRTDSVKVEYTAPDETIRVSIRAFLDHFTRGKICLQLVG